MFRSFVFCLSVCFCVTTPLRGEPVDDATQHRGYQLIVDRAYVPPDLNEEIFTNIWRCWPEPLREQAEAASDEERRAMAFSRYGLTERPGDDSGRPLQYVVDDAGNWSMNCFACHGGKVAGQIVPGLPNSHIALQTLMEDVRETKKLLGKPLTAKDLGSIFFPYNRTDGTTNAVMFGVFLGAFRDADLNVVDMPFPQLTHHDMDAPPWWHFHRRQRLYIDGFAQKSHRALMPFMLTRNNGPAAFHKAEDDFRVIYDYLASVRPPKYPFAIDDDLAERGRLVFNDNCADCHGTYGADAHYEHVTVPIDEIGTDRVRLDALPVAYRERYGQGWFTRYGRDETIADPAGYVAPPLDGIWASAPYFHNGSVPTLWHVLRPNQRPNIWRRTEDGYDRQRVGLEVESFDRLPRIANRAELRAIVDTRRFGHSAAGHNYPAALTEAEKRSVLEYLKTL